MNTTPAVSHAESGRPVDEVAGPPPRPGSAGRLLVRAVPAVLLAAGMLWLALPRLVNATVHDIGYALSAVTSSESVVLVLLWAAGLGVWAFAQQAALPGLGFWRALTLNQTGSAVSNVLPAGGAVGMSLNYYMLRRWGHTPAEFSAYTLVTNVAQVLMKLALPAGACAALVVTGARVSEPLRWTASVGAVVLIAILGGFVLVLARPGAMTWMVRWLAPALAWVTRVVRRPVPREQMAETLVDFRDHVAALVSGHGRVLMAACLGYALLQAGLLWACLSVVGAHTSPALVLAAYAVNGVLSMVPITPGGSGFAEAGMAGVLVALGGAPAAVTAGVLLWRGFVFALEIPVGGLWLAGWWWRSRR